MKTIFKKLNSKKLAKEIDSYGYAIEANIIAHRLMELYLKRFDDFHLIIGEDFVEKYGTNPFSTIGQFTDFCYLIARYVNNTMCYPRGYYAQLKSTGIFQYIGLTKKKKEATDPETLIQYIEDVYANGLNP